MTSSLLNQSTPATKTKVVLGIEYNGQKYYGWQKQQEVPSIQAALERAISQVADEPIQVFCAGRTDAGVHAIGQVVHFETSAKREDFAWTMGVNAHLPADIAVHWVTYCDGDFHARFSAIARRYRYFIYNNRYRSAIFPHGVTHYPMPLDEQRMQRAGDYLIGEHDFSAFRAAQCQSSSPFRNVKHLLVQRKGDYVMVDIKANAFVQHMVRNIVGSLLVVGSGLQPEEWITELLMSKDRTQAAATAKASGLYLVSVDYPECYSIPKVSVDPFCGMV